MHAQSSLSMVVLTSRVLLQKAPRICSSFAWWLIHTPAPHSMWWREQPCWILKASRKQIKRFTINSFAQP